ncbi:hypothetical protein [Anaplasma phagocytophilum]|uniref:hypothetical protein n=1 Tax=Anaplasma phagocytophilum TaxID=948 RepID=UPI0012DA5E7B|nr:hypothetical protein [Anaplasma phagocytophilum]
MVWYCGHYVPQALWFFLDSRSEEKRIKDGDAIYDVLRRNDESVEQKLAEVSEKFYEDYKNRTFSKGVC